MRRNGVSRIIFVNIMVVILLFGTSCNNIHNTGKATPQDYKNSEEKVNDESLNKSNDEVISKPKESSEASKVIDEPKPKLYPITDDFKGVPVLMYHSIDYEPKNELRVSKEKFEEQMKYLKDNGYTTLTMEELYDSLGRTGLIPEKPVLISFDDGYIDNYTNAYPILKKYNLKATVFIITNLVDKTSDYLNSSQMREMIDSGINMESHTLNHDELNLLSYEKQLNTLSKSKKDLENIIGKEVISIAYPFGKYNDNTLKAIEASDYKMAFTTRPGFAKRKSGLLTLSRVRINGSDSLSSFAAKIGA